MRRLRRRTRTSSLRSNKHPSSAKERLRGEEEREKDEDTTRPKRVNAEEILFGGTLGKHHVSCSVELDSDQESTDGETEVGEEDLRRSEVHTGEGESDILELTPNSLLYR